MRDGTNGQDVGPASLGSKVRPDHKLAGTPGSGRASQHLTFRRLERASEEGAPSLSPPGARVLTSFLLSYAAISAVLVSKKVVDVMAAGSGPSSPFPH